MAELGRAGNRKRRSTIYFVVSILYTTYIDYPAQKTVELTVVYTSSVDYNNT